MRTWHLRFVTFVKKILALRFGVDVTLPRSKVPAWEHLKISERQLANVEVLGESFGFSKRAVRSPDAEMAS